MRCACPSQRGSLKHLSKHPLKKELVGFPAWGIAQIFWNHTEEAFTFVSGKATFRHKGRFTVLFGYGSIISDCRVSARFLAFNPYYHSPAGDN
jgi:hypothetical protein